MDRRTITDIPSQHRSVDPDDGVVRRYHLYDSVPQRAIKEAARMAGIAKTVSCHTLRHSFAIQAEVCHN